MTRPCSRWLFLGLGALLAVACDRANPPGPTALAEQPVLAGDAVMPPGPLDERALAAEAAIKASSEEPRPHWRTIDASDTTLRPVLDWRDLPESAISLVGLPLPVLLPDVGELLAVALLTHGPRWYGASMTTDGHNVYVHATATTHVVAGATPSADQVAYDGGVRVTRNEAAVTLTFEAYGVAYSISVECESPFTDVRCSEDDYVLGLAESMGRLEGQP